MISKELLSEVLEKKLYLEHLWYITNSELLYYTEENGGGTYINIHELAHKCKEWAWDNLWIIGSVKNKSKTYECFIEEVLGFDAIEFEADTEPEAIFKACEWILKESRCLK